MSPTSRRTARLPIPYARTAIPACLTIVSLADGAFAQTASAAAAAVPEAPGVSGAAILQMLLGLCLIIGFLFLGAYLLRKLNGGRGFGHSGPLRVVGGLMLSARERIVLLEIGDEWLVVGIVPGQIKTLHTLPKGEMPAPATGDKPFAQWLKQISERKKHDAD